MLWRNFLSPEFRTKFQREVPLFFAITEFPFNTVQDGWKEARVPKTSSIRTAVLVELRLVMDGQTDTGPWLVPRMHRRSRPDYDFGGPVGKTVMRGMHFITAR